jgi:hypothetical protein
LQGDFVIRTLEKQIDVLKQGTLNDGRDAGMQDQNFNHLLQTRKYRQTEKSQGRKKYHMKEESIETVNFLPLYNLSA